MKEGGSEGCKPSFVFNHHNQIMDLCKRMSGGLEAVSKLHPDQVMYLRYEDLARRPVAVSQLVYNFLGLDFDEETRQVVERIVKRQRFDGKIDSGRLLMDAATSWPQALISACGNLVKYGYI